VRDGRGALYCFTESNKSGNEQPDLKGHAQIKTLFIIKLIAFAIVNSHRNWFFLSKGSLILKPALEMTRQPQPSGVAAGKT
jgi:hypothetical protein